VRLDERGGCPGEPVRIVQRQISPELVPRPFRRLLPVIERVAGWNLILKAVKP